MSNQVNSMNKGLTVKDLVTTGIFTALLFVFVLVGGVFFATNPVLTFFMPAGGGLLAGPIYLLLIAKDKLSLSDFVAFLLYVNLFMKPLLRLTVFTEMYQRGMAGFQRFYEIMDMQPEIIDNKNAIDCVQIRGEIEFDNLVLVILNRGK